MVFPGLDSAFGGIATVVMRRDTLEIDVVFVEGGFDGVGALVVEDVEFRSIAVGLELFEGGEPSVTDGATVAVG